MTDKELVKFVRSFRRGLLGRRTSRGKCYMVCAPLTTFLAMHGVPNEMQCVEHAGGNHFFLRLPDGRVLDPTLDQYEPSVGTVYLGKPLRHWHG